MELIQDITLIILSVIALLLTIILLTGIIALIVLIVKHFFCNTEDEEEKQYNNFVHETVSELDTREDKSDEHIHTDDEEEWTELAQEFRDNGKIWLYGKFSEYNKLSGINVPDILKNEVVGFLDWLKNNK